MENALGSGNFSGQYEGISIVGCNEFYAMSTTGRDSNVAEATRSSIFDLIDNRYMVIELKGIGPYTADNYMRFIFTTNKSAAMPQGTQGSRFAVFEISSCRKGDKEFFSKLHDVFDRKDDELDRFVTILASIDLTGFHPQVDKPHTREVTEQLELAAIGSKKWLIDLLDRGELWAVAPGEQMHSFPTYKVTSADITALVERNIGHRIGITSTAFGREVMNVLAADDAKDVWTKSGTKSGRRVPELMIARRQFEERVNGGVSINWSNDLTTWVVTYT